MNPSLPTTKYTAAEVAELDRYTVEDLGVDLKQLMEVAGMRSSEAAIDIIKGKKSVTVLAGPGGNGGDALVAAKWLKLWELEPVVLLSHDHDRLRDVTKHQLAVWNAFEGEVLDHPPERTDLIVDGLLGYSLEGDPRGRAADFINWANDSNAPVLALDVPSGLDATSGEAKTPCINAVKTVVYGVYKQGLFEKDGPEHAGMIELIDIGFPREFPI